MQEPCGKPDNNPAEIIPTIAERLKHFVRLLARQAARDAAAERRGGGQ
jgi:hypothetical protein